MLEIERVPGETGAVERYVDIEMATPDGVSGGFLPRLAGQELDVSMHLAEGSSQGLRNSSPVVKYCGRWQNLGEGDGSGPNLSEQDEARQDHL